MTHDSPSQSKSHSSQWLGKSVAENYDARRFKSLGGRFYDACEKRAIRELLQVAEERAAIREVLEMASGTGRISEVLAERGYNLTCGDVSREMQEVARRRLANTSLRNVNFELLDIYDIAHADDTFDCVCAFRLFQHLVSSERALALREMARVTRRFVLVSVMYTSAYYGTLRQLRQVLGRYTTRCTSTRNEIADECRFAGLALVRSVFSQPGFNGNMILLMEKHQATYPTR